MEEQKGTKELVEVVDFAMGLAKLGVDIGADKKVDMSDLGLALQRIPELAGVAVMAFQGIGEVPMELKDMSEEEAAKLVAHVMGKLAVEEPKARAIVEASLKASYAGYALVKAIVA